MPSYIAFRTARNFCCLDVYGNHFFVTLELRPQASHGMRFRP